MSLEGEQGTIILEEHNLLTVLAPKCDFLSANTTILTSSFSSLLAFLLAVWQVLFRARRRRARARSASNDSKKVSLHYLYLLYDEERNREELFLFGNFSWL